MSFAKHLGAFFLGFFSCFVLVFIVGIGYGILFESKNYNEKPFEQVSWKQERNSSVRLQMTKDLQFYYISNGMKEKEIVELLGTPDLQLGDSLISYKIGSRGLLAPRQNLVFRMKDNLVKHFAIE